MKALAWDDQPDTYLAWLAPHLEGYEVRLEIESEVGTFLRRLRTERWDFVISDLFSPVVPGSEEDQPADGVRIASAVAELGLPVFVITKEYDRAVAETAVPRAAILKSKSTHVEWMAEEIIHELERLGLWGNSRTVFVIHGHDRKARGASEAVCGFLRKEGYDVDVISSGNLDSEIMSGLLKRMGECKAFIAVCSPDDEWTDGTRHPRQNAMLEVGIAIGLSRSLHRLTVLRRSSPGGDLEKDTVLPSDMDGIVTIDFSNRIEEVYDDLLTRLDKLGLEKRDDG